MMRRLSTLALMLAAAFAVPGRATPPPPAGDAEVRPLLPLYVVRFTEPSLARLAAAVPEAAFSRTARGKLDPGSPASRAALEAIDRLHRDRLDAVERRLGRPATAVFRYRAVLNGVALRLTAREAAAVRRLPGVAAVSRDRIRAAETDAGPTWIGAATVWDGSATTPLPATRGEGVVVAVLDTGVNMDHAAFSDVTDDGYVFTNPLGSGNYLGWCDPGHPDYDPAYVCNDKLIGAWDFVDAVTAESDGPEDDGFHGSHVASIAVGNTTTWPAVSGVAPRAQLIAYDVCAGTANCPTTAIVAAIDQAVLDGVDVLNLSIGGGASPWTDPIELALLDAVAAGIFVATSAGNDGPAAGTVGHRGPWTATVAASSHDRVSSDNALVDLAGGAGLPPADLPGQSFTSGYGPAPIVYQGDCTGTFAPGTWSGGEIVVCDHAGTGRLVLCGHVKAGGAAGCVVANIMGGIPFVGADFHALPATHLDEPEGDALRAWLAGGSGPTATLSDSVSVKDAAAADRIRDFSSRGPSSVEVLKPDLAAPGAGILAAVGSFLIPGFVGDEYLQFSGTSQASPHVAGAAALLLSARGWLSPTEVRSALMTTAATALFEEDGVTVADPFDRGAGRVDLSRAARAGLVLDEIASRYLAADPGSGGDPRTLNLPGLVEDDCSQTCGWQRVVTATLDGPVHWTATAAGFTDLALIVSPPSFTLSGAGTTRQLDISLRVDGGPLGGWVFGELVLTPDDPGVPEARLPVAVKPTAVAAVTPTLTVTKTATPVTVDEPGAVVSFTVRVDNTGTVTVDLSGLVDDVHGDLDGQGTCALPQTVGIGGFYECAFTALVDGNAGDLEEDTVTATGSGGGVPVAAQGAESVSIGGVAPSIAVSRTASPVEVRAPGEAVTFTVMVTNTSTASSDPVTITSLVDDVHGDLDGAGDCAVPQVLAPGNGFSCSYLRTVAGTGGETEVSTTTAGGSDDDGAPVAAGDAAAVDVLEAVPPVVSSVAESPADGDGLLGECRSLRVQPDQLVLAFSEALEATAAGSAASYLLVRPGDDLAFQTTSCSAAGDDQAVSLSVGWSPAGPTATLGFAPLPNGLYRLFACGLEDLAGNALDGDGDGTGGDDFGRAFRVDAGNLFANGHLDCVLEPWSEVETAPAEITHDPTDDATGDGASGSASIANLSGTAPLGLSQCAELPGAGPLRLTARYRITTANETLSVDLGCEAWDAAGCTGTSLATPAVGVARGVTAGWRQLALAWTAPPGAVSAGCEILVRAPVGTYFAAGTDSLDLAQVLFADGFESGSTSAWSRTVPWP